jgi:hypothetical protein
VSVVLTQITLLIPAFALLLAPPVLAVWLLSSGERSPTISLVVRSTASVRDLSLDTLVVPLHSTSELLRTLSRMAASKPTSWLFGRNDALAH